MSLVSLKHKLSQQKGLRFTGFEINDFVDLKEQSEV